jgi:hypothetical protein
MVEQSQEGLTIVAASAGVERADVDARTRISRRVFIGRILCVAVPIALWFAPLDLDLTAKRAWASSNSTSHSAASPTTRHGFCSAPLKYMMARLGLLETPEVRLPLVPLDAERGMILDDALRRAGLL